MGVTVHAFESTTDAYDSVNCGWHVGHDVDEVPVGDGDVLVVASEGVAGVACKAWPVAVTAERGAFHRLAEGASWMILMGQDYTGSLAAAVSAAANAGIGTTEEG